MELDVEKTFGEIHSSDQDFKSQLFRLRELTSSRDHYRPWAHRLRFIVPSSEGHSNAANGEQDPEIDELVRSNDEHTDEDVAGEFDRTGDSSSSASSSHSTKGESCGCDKWPSFYGRQNDRILKLTEPGCCLDCTHYVAVSWCWNGSDERIAPTQHFVAEPYTMVTSTGSCESKVPPNVFFRAILYAARYDIRFIWIDKECIDQDDPKDKEYGIQSMDIVYQRSTSPLGLLQSYFDKQTHLNIWDMLIQGQSVPMEMMADLAEVLNILQADLWFTRAWILQESVAGGLEMQLLMQHDRSLRKSRYLGDIPGELQLSIFEFQTAITWAETCLQEHANQIPGGFRTDLERAIQRLWTFNPLSIPELWESVVRDPSYRQTCNAAQALSFLNLRQNSRVVDRLALLANLCDYPVRMDTMELENGCFGFSTCAYALAFLNGDLSLVPGIAQFPWMPSRHQTLASLPYVEEDDKPSRVDPLELLRRLSAEL